MTAYPKPALAEMIEQFTPIDLGSDHRAGWKEDGNLWWWHACTVGSGIGSIDCTTGQFHSLISREPMHIEASVLCATCGDHGWIRDGKWVTA